MAFYTFTVEGFHIDKLRSLIQDTDEVSGSLQVGSDKLPAQSRSNGSIGGGDYPIGFVFGPKLVSQSTTPVVLCYLIYNGDASKLPNSLAGFSADLVGKAVQSLITAKSPEQYDLNDITRDGVDSDNFNWDDPSWIKLLEVVTLASFVFPDCDGFVAAGTIAKVKTSWDALIDQAGGVTLHQSVRYPGSDSPSGCGGNSDYTVRWSVLRERVSGPGPHSLRQFLATHQLSAKSGLRPLIPGEPVISVRGLMT
ncbi:MAG: hypothetical protein WBS19_05825 [Candidatus Korobacteraceae bacterium]